MSKIPAFLSEYGWIIFILFVGGMTWLGYRADSKMREERRGEAMLDEVNSKNYEDENIQ